MAPPAGPTALWFPRKGLVLLGCPLAQASGAGARPGRGERTRCGRGWQRGHPTPRDPLALSSLPTRVPSSALLGQGAPGAPGGGTPKTSVPNSRQEGGCPHGVGVTQERQPRGGTGGTFPDSPWTTSGGLSTGRRAAACGPGVPAGAAASRPPPTSTHGPRWGPASALRPRALRTSRSNLTAGA